MVPNADAGPQLDVPELTRIAVTSRAKITSENFPVALRVLPRRPRDLLSRAYAFARFVDDVGDTAAGDRLALLDAVADDVRALPGGGARLEPVRGMAPLVSACGLQPMLDLLEANRRDQTITRYETFDDLLEYCRYSAAPVGRIVLAVAGVDDPLAQQRSDQVCNALQVLEHCQDVGEDAAAGRVYLPALDLRAAGVADADLRARVTSVPLRRVIALQADRAAAMLAAGTPLVHSLRGWARIAVAGYVAGGRATVAALRDGGYDVLDRHLAPATRTTAFHAARILAGG